MARTRFNPNEIIINGNIAKIILYDKNCKEKARAIIDTEDVARVKVHKWHAVEKSGGLYAATRINGKATYLSNFIMGFKSNCKNMIDHADRVTLNNHKGNLRAATKTQNQCNQKMYKNNTSGHRGVFWRENRNKWYAKIVVRKKQIHLGHFSDKIKAAIAYNKAALKYFGEFASLNKIHNKELIL